MNSVRLEGRVVWAPRVTKLISGKVVANFALDVPTGRGERRTTLRCVAWESDTGVVELAQDDWAKVEGRLESRSYEKDGRKIEVTEVIAEFVEKVAHKSVGPSRKPTAEVQDEIPF